MKNRAAKALPDKKQSSASARPATVHEFPAAKRQVEEPKAPLPKQHQQRPGLESEITPRPNYQAPAYRSAGKLKDKVAIVTGGDSGIGRGVALLFAREGADVAIIYLEEEQSDAEETRDAVESEDRRCLLLPGDVSDPKFCYKAVQQVIRQFGCLDILVNNAGYQQHQTSPEELSEEQWDHTFKVNIYGYFHMVKASLPHLGPGSAIVNTSSETGLEGNKQLLDYSATKGAINAFTKSLAQMLVERGIRVNAVAPGPVWTPLNVADKEAEQVAQHGIDVPLKRPAQPEELAPAYVFLASEADSSYITGLVLEVMGGKTVAG